MKSNLDKAYKSDIELEKEGIWFEVQEGVKFRVKRFGGTNPDVKKSLAKYFKPHAKLIEKGLLPEDKERAIYVRAFVASCLVDWSGVEIDGEIEEYNSEDAIALFKQLPELFDILVEYAQQGENYREELGN